MHAPTRHQWSTSSQYLMRAQSHSRRMVRSQPGLESRQPVQAAPLLQGKVPRLSLVEPGMHRY
jgi:hypothetical protein